MRGHAICVNNRSRESPTDHHPRPSARPREQSPTPLRCRRRSGSFRPFCRKGSARPRACPDPRRRTSSAPAMSRSRCTTSRPTGPRPGRPNGPRWTRHSGRRPAATSSGRGRPCTTATRPTKCSTTCPRAICAGSCPGTEGRSRRPSSAGSPSSARRRCRDTHAQLLTHRDVKPDNILVRDPDRPEVCTDRFRHRTGPQSEAAVVAGGDSQRADGPDRRPDPSPTCHRRQGN